MVACPWCKTAKFVYEHGQREYWCSRCRRLFDDDPDEGGDYATGDPSRRIVRQEEGLNALRALRNRLGRSQRTARMQ